ncbi:hypothetical protein [Burkholderia pseudomallei]|uniref:hypothetical protein n=1 Tax=Burkholderia pseudomallei TaxID=28450 RepID=UPI0012F9EEA1|nr:hypothetical protein [Burkholderia pseudomallei]
MTTNMPPAIVERMHLHLASLERTVSEVSVRRTGIQGVRIMRLVALMSGLEVVCTPNGMRIDPVSPYAVGHARERANRRDARRKRNLWISLVMTAGIGAGVVGMTCFPGTIDYRGSLPSGPAKLKSAEQPLLLVPAASDNDRAPAVVTRPERPARSMTRSTVIRGKRAGAATSREFGRRVAAVSNRGRIDLDTSSMLTTLHGDASGIAASLEPIAPRDQIRERPSVKNWMERRNQRRITDIFNEPGGP